MEAHHIVGLAELIERHGIKNRDDARNTPELWDVNNGETICEPCHYMEHCRRYTLKINAETFAKMPPHLRALFNKLSNPGRNEVVDIFPESSSSSAVMPLPKTPGDSVGSDHGNSDHPPTLRGFDDEGSAARFFASFPLSLEHGERSSARSRLYYSTKADDGDRPHSKGSVIHPTVKPLDLMRYLVRLVCPRGGAVLDPFMGSGSTGCAAVAEGMTFVGVEQLQEYADIAVGRLKLALDGAPDLVDIKVGELRGIASAPAPRRMR